VCSRLLVAREGWALRLVGVVEGHLALLALSVWVEEVDWGCRVSALGRLLLQGVREGRLEESLLLWWLRFLAQEIVAAPRFAVLCHLAFAE
jgi:hypothetical protein